MINEVQSTVDPNQIKVIESQSMIPFAITIGIILAVLIILKFVIEAVRSRPKRTGIERTHSLKGLRESAIKKELEQSLVENASVKRRYKIETLCTQAGFNLSFGEYVLICFFCAIFLPIIIISVLDNIYLALMMIVIGALLPGQFISFMRNRRISILERQVESFMELFAERYKTIRNPTRSLEDCLKDFDGQEPIRHEIKKTLLDINLGMTTIEAMRGFAFRTGNTYLSKMVESVRVAEDIGTDEVRDRLISKALEAHRKKKTRFNNLKQRIQGPKNESMILLGAVPFVMVYQAMTSESYLDFMFNTEMGKGGLAIIAGICLFAIWFINKKIGAPLE